MAMFSWSTAKHSCKKLVGCNARLMTSNGKGNLMSDTLKAAARAGDPKALEALMNKSLGSRGSSRLAGLQEVDLLGDPSHPEGSRVSLADMGS